jgi:phage major head subunit gpT-like protein
VFNNAFSAAYVGGDGKALCADDHKLTESSALTVDNKGTYELTAPNLETVRTAMMGWKDDKGNLIPIMPDTILVPPALRKAAIIIADSDKEPDTSDNNVNVWKGALNVIECRFLTDANAWFLIDSSKMKNNLIWFDRRKPDFGTDNEFDTEVSKYKTIARFSYGFYSPLWVYGSNPA